MASEFLKQKLPEDFPDKLWMKLNHIILSHHDELEYGAVVRPQTLEASIVSVADKASSTVRQFQKALEESEGNDSDFTDYQKWIGVKVYKG
jgi:3'-5' exoribonuclease